jgi:hypothetical protein
MNGFAVTLELRLIVAVLKTAAALPVPRRVDASVASEMRPAFAARCLVKMLLLIMGEKEERSEIEGPEVHLAAFARATMHGGRHFCMS